MEALRVSINEWIRDSALFDYMVDADALLRDPKNPSFTDERYHQGDHLHPNQAGGMLLAQAYDFAKADWGGISMGKSISRSALMMDWNRTNG